MHRPYHFVLSRRIIFLVVLLACITIFIDTSLIQLSVHTGSAESPFQELYLLSLIVVSAAIFQLLVLKFVRSGLQTAKERGNSNKLSNVVTLIQAAVMVLVFVILFEAYFSSSYKSVLLKAILVLSYSTASIMFGYLSLKFFSWARFHRNITILAYAASMLILSLNTILAMAYVLGTLTAQRGMESVVDMEFLVVVAQTDSLFSRLYLASSIVSFIATWFATTLLLRNYSRKTGRVVYWVLVALPLLYYAQFQTTFIDFFSQLRESEPILFGIAYTFLSNASKPIGGILFGAAFWGIARSIDKTEIKNYMAFSAYGVMLFFTSNQPINMTYLPYPPFGLTTITFVGLGAYLVFLGIYSSAISMSNDTTIRKSVRRSLEKEQDLLADIGNAEIQDQVQNRAMKLTKMVEQSIEYQTGVESSLEEDDVKEYISEVIEELRTRSEDSTSQKNETG